MPYKLKTALVLAGAAEDFQITSVTTDHESGELHLAYNLLDAQGKVITDTVLTVDPLDVLQAIASTNALILKQATPDIRAALKTIYYELIEKDRGFAANSGTIT